MKTSNIYTQEQIKRVLVGSGVDIEAEFGNDFIIFCPYHNNNRTPAGEVAKDSGLFFCFGCQTTKNLEELIMHMSGRTYFEAVRYIKSKETEHDIEKLVNKTLVAPPEFTPYDELILKRLHNQLLADEKPKNYLKYRKINISLMFAVRVSRMTLRKNGNPMIKEGERVIAMAMKNPALKILETFLSFCFSKKI